MGPAESILVVPFVIVVGQILVTGLAVGIVFIAILGFAALGPHLLVVAPIAVVVVALLAGVALYFAGRRRGGAQEEWAADMGEDLPPAVAVKTPAVALMRPRSLRAKTSKRLQNELAAARSRMPRVEAVEEENRRLKAHVAALTRLLISKGVFNAEEIAGFIASVQGEEVAHPPDDPPPHAPRDAIPTNDDEGGSPESRSSAG
jgi:hypothetical protein